MADCLGAPGFHFRGGGSIEGGVEGGGGSIEGVVGGVRGSIDRHHESVVMNCGGEGAEFFLSIGIG